MIWMPHAGHFICGDHCRFHLNTYVNGYIVSTIGDYWPERDVRAICAQVHSPGWLVKNKHLRGDYFDNAYFEKFGYEKIGSDRKYETMVFKAKKSRNACCPYVMKTPCNIDFAGYNNPRNAYEGHLKMCRKYLKRRKT